MTPDATAATDAMRSIERVYLIGVEGATEVWLVRHGDCYEGLTDLGATLHGDPPLSALGREQTARLAERLLRIRVDAVYSSPLRRAQETAQLVAGDVQLDGRLIEVETRLEGGHVQVVEKPEHVVERMSGAVADAVAAHPGGRVVMVGHGVAILMYIGDVLRLEFGQLRLLPYYTSVSVVRVLGERRMVGGLGDTAHLEASPDPPTVRA